jgi:hypothetical protein
MLCMGLGVSHGESWPAQGTSLCYLFWWKWKVWIKTRWRNKGHLDQLGVSPTAIQHKFGVIIKLIKRVERRIDQAFQGFILVNFDLWRADDFFVFSLYSLLVLCNIHVVHTVFLLICLILWICCNMISILYQCCKEENIQYDICSIINIQVSFYFH